jgi:hypothetical protein
VEAAEAAEAVVAEAVVAEEVVVVAGTRVAASP